ncbi:MAG: hypothetical protein GX557_01255 [Chloroflexi bacterium]|nr:hypothetical protein [Chloroflexota bacterium]
MSPKVRCSAARRLISMALIGLLLGVLALAQAVWAAPSQLPARQTVPTRTHTLAPSRTATATALPTATYTPTLTPSAAPTSAPTSAPAATDAPAGPTTAPTLDSLAATAVPTPAQLPVAGADWSGRLLRSAGLALGTLALVLLGAALTFARRAPTAGRER